MERRPEPPFGGWSRTDIWHIALILCVVAASYANALGGGFVTDDFGLLRDNPNVKDWGRLADIFTTGYWEAEGKTGGLYRPLTIFSFLIEHTIAGAKPFLYHLDNAILHFLCSVLAYFLLRSILADTTTPLLAALFFAAHPVHVEAVAWISGRSELLWAFFGLSSMLVFVRLPHRPLYTALYTGLYTLAIFSKESAVTVPAILASYMFIFDKTESFPIWIRRLAARLWPYVVVTAVFLAVKLLVIGRLGPRPEEQALALMNSYDKFLIMARVLFEYIRLGFIPTGYCNNYLFPPPESILNVRVLLSLAAVIGSAVLSPWLLRNSRTALFAILWFFIGLIPVSNIFPSGIIMSDRAMYLPSIGICILIGSGLSLAERTLARRRVFGIPMPALFLLLALGPFEAVTVSTNNTWHDYMSESTAVINRLYQNIKIYPESTVLRQILAGMLYRFRPYSPETEKAISEVYNRMGPDTPVSREMMSYVYSEHHMPEKALAEMQAAINMAPDYAPYHFTAAKILMKLKRYQEALAMAVNAARLNPNADDYRMLKGDILMEMGDDDAALMEYEAAGSLNPENQDAFLMQGIILDSKREFGQAIELIGRAVRLRPDIPDLHYFLAVAYMDAGLPEQAAGELDRAISLKPDYREAAELKARLQGSELMYPR